MPFPKVGGGGFRPPTTSPKPSTAPSTSPSKGPSAASVGAQIVGTHADALQAGQGLHSATKPSESKPTTPLQHTFDDYDVDRNRFYGTYGPTDSTRFKPFQQLDLRLDKNFVFERWTLDAYIDVQNVYNASNVEATFYDYRYRQTFDVPGIPFLPVIGVKGSF